MELQWPATSLVAQGRRLSLSWGFPSVRKAGFKFCVSCTSQQLKTAQTQVPVEDESQSQKMIVCITGATGFIGRRLVSKLAEDGHQVRVVARSISKAEKVFPAGNHPNIEVVLDSELRSSLEGSTGVVNLTGTPISTRWTTDAKDEIKRSRINVTKQIVDCINSSPPELRPKVFVSASAVGYYGTSEVGTYDETSPAGDDFLAKVCRKWENSAREVDDSVKLVLIRIGIVLDKDGGALEKMVPMFKLFAGGPIGSGKQWFSWVHREDLVRLIIEALSNPRYEGVINGTAPNPVRMAEICETLGRVLGRPSWLPVPELALKVVLGEGASAVLEGQRVVPKKAQDLGFKFKYRYIGDALKAIFAS